MKSNHLELLVGIFVLLGLAAVAYLSIKLGSGSTVGGQTYHIEARFANSGGLNRGASVLVAGVTIGRVDRIYLDPEDFSAIAVLRVRRDILLPADTMASIKTTGLIGDKYISLAPGADDIYLEPGERIVMTESAVDLESLIGRMAFGSVNEDSEETANEELNELTPP
jgi:phospholipid/cholesterol/gamma-HCH transport system substrate-binding protein